MVYARGERGPREFYSGRELEVDLFGKPKFPRGYIETLQRLAGDRGFLPYQKSQELIREYYPEDSTHPSKEFARDLRLALCDALELEGDDGDAIKFYSAVGTPLDHFHGVDGWVEIDLDNGKGGFLHAEVTLDATKRPEKLEEGHKADVIIGNVAAPDDEKYLEEVDKYASEIAELLFSRLQAETNRRVVGGRR